jgi:predicted kinase
MTTPPTTRSVKISDDERGGWSSDRPRRDGRPPRPADLSVRCRLLHPTDRMRYSPGSLLLITSGSDAARDAFADRLIQNKGSLLSIGKVRALLAGRVPDEDIEDRASELLLAAAGKRFEAGDTVVIAVDGLTPEDREPYVRAAAANRRPRHVIMLDVGRDQVGDDDRAAVNELRRALDAGELGSEGIQTALRLSDASISELKRIVFQPEPKDE